MRIRTLEKSEMRGLKKAEKHLIKWFVIKGSVMKKLISIAALSVFTALYSSPRGINYWKWGCSVRYEYRAGLQCSSNKW